jgi:hypothetical protein
MKAGACDYSEFQILITEMLKGNGNFLSDLKGHYHKRSIRQFSASSAKKFNINRRDLSDGVFVPIP